VSVHRGGPAAHDSHVWGAHKHGIRWVQCQRCECLLHEPEAVDVCSGDPGVPAARRAREYERLMAAPHGASERPVPRGLRDALEWYRAHRWPVLVSTGMHGIAGGVIELGEGHAVLRNQSSTVNVPLRRVRRVRPWWEQTPGDAPVWEAAAASSGGGSG
jgi:hypothetical protein